MSEIEEVYRAPPRSEWHDLVRLRAESPELQQIRAELRDAAHAFRLQKEQFAELLGFSLPPLKNFDVLAPIIGVGHQPMVYHWGLLRKQLDAVSLAHEVHGSCLNIIIDTDPTDCGTILIPMRDDRALLRRTHYDFADYHALGVKAVVKKDAHEIFSKIAGELKAVAISVPPDHKNLFDGILKGAGDASWIVCNSVLRELLHPDSTSHEICLTSVCELPSIKKFFAKLLEDGDSLHTRYNAALAKFRAERKIQNLANPFPNLKEEVGTKELPFWRWDSEGRRLPLSDLSNFAPTNDINVPRGAMITLLFRSVLTDLFVHGRGGEIYDQFLPSLAKELNHGAIAPMVVSSETKLLFPHDAKKLSQAALIEKNKKDLISHTERYQSLLPSDMHGMLSDSLQRRKQILAELPRVSSAARSTMLHELNAINTAIRNQIEPWVAEQTRSTLALPEEHRATILERTYPTWLFAHP